MGTGHQEEAPLNGEQTSEQVNYEWSRIKGYSSRLDGKEFGGDLFSWRPSANSDVPDLLVLRDVAVSFRADKAVALHVCFRRRPPESGKLWHGPSPVPLVTWFLEPSIKDRTFGWVVREYSEVDDPTRPVNIFENRDDGLTKGNFPPEELAKQIESRIIEHHKKFRDQVES